MKKIEQLRKEKNMTQEQLAKKMGVGQAVVSKWENEKASPTAGKIPKLAKLLGCKIDDLF